MNWRKEIKLLFETNIVNMFGDEVTVFAPYNNQKNDRQEQITNDQLHVLFNYDNIEPERRYFQKENSQYAHAINATVSIRLLFFDYSDNAQDLAYDYAEALKKSMQGAKHKLISGKIEVLAENEDNRYSTLYEYQMTFKVIVIDDMKLDEADLLKPLQVNSRIFGAILKIK